MRTIRTSQRFRDWVADYGVCALARELKLTDGAVSRYKTGKANPDAKHFPTILRLAGKRLSVSDMAGGEQ